MSQTLIEEVKTELSAIDRQLSMLQTRRGKLLDLLESYGDVGTNSGERMTTIAMAREVLAEHGSAMGTAEIRRAIERKFSIAPAPSLQQMLFNRARKGKIFYNENMKYGLLDWRGKVTSPANRIS